MKPKLATLSLAGVAATLISACGHDDTMTMSPPPPPPPTVQSLDTAAVLAMAMMSSESSDPIAVNEGVVVLTDTSETTDPIAIDAM